MAWIYILVAGIFESVWAIGLKYADGFTKLVPSVGTLLAMIISVYLLSLGTRTLPIGTAYAAWTGIGVIGTAIFGIFFLGEPRDFIRIVSLIFIVAGIVGLKITS